MSHIDDFNRELVRQIAGAFNGVEIRPLNVDQAADCLSSAQERGDQFEQIVRLVNGLRALGWIVCPPLPGINTDAEELADNLLFADKLRRGEVKIGGTE